MRVSDIIQRFPRLHRRYALATAYSRAFGSPEGQLVLRDLLREGGMLSVSHVEGDAHSTAFNDGKRALALHIVQRLRWSEGELLQLGQELAADTLAGMEAQEAA